MVSLEAGLYSFALENKEVIITASILVLGALTAAQRLAILRRDGGRCLGEEVGIHHTHRGRLEVNHSPPQAWSITHDLDPDAHPEVAKISLCEEAHDLYHRRDMTRARNEYRRGNKDAYKEMCERHHLLASQNEVFWESGYDLAIHTLHRQNELKAKLWGWFWPMKRVRK